MPARPARACSTRSTRSSPPNERLFDRAFNALTSARPGPVHVLERSQRVPLPPAEAFEFFADAFNLERITPPFLAFRVTTPAPIEIGEGTLIDYRLKLHGLPVGWQTRIESWEPPHRFVDRQIRGPYALWEHTHTVEPDGEDGSLIGDCVRYSVGLGRLGVAAHSLLVRRDVEAIFDYRSEAVTKILAA